MGSVAHCSLCFAKQLPSEVGLLQDDFSDEKSVLADTKRKTAVPLFFASTGGLRLPPFQAYTASKFYIILITLQLLLPLSLLLRIFHTE